jgi:hypothetical protein
MLISMREKEVNGAPAVAGYSVPNSGPLPVPSSSSAPSETSKASRTSSSAQPGAPTGSVPAPPQANPWKGAAPNISVTTPSSPVRSLSPSFSHFLLYLLALFAKDLS